MRDLLIDLTGKRFGRLIVLRQDEYRCKKVHWLCQCDCGEKTIVRSVNLRKGRTKSCGCLRAEIMALSSSSHIKHGHSIGNGTPEYSTWNSMRDRCRNPKDSEYKNYGGRGITICERWNDFEKFLDDMGPRPIELTIDRIDNNGNYEPGNCRWATRIQQGNNQRTNRRLTFNGETKTIAEWARFLGISYNGLWNRINRGLSIELALTTPKR